jgi:hypothetical protein
MAAVWPGKGAGAAGVGGVEREAGRGPAGVRRPRAYRAARSGKKGHPGGMWSGGGPGAFCS